MKNATEPINEDFEIYVEALYVFDDDAYQHNNSTGGYEVIGEDFDLYIEELWDMEDPSEPINEDFEIHVDTLVAW